MKTIVTFLILSLVSLGVFAQDTEKPIKKNELASSLSASNTQAFSIVTVYPNPVREFVTIDVQSKVSESIQISLYNILGSEIKKWDSNTLRQGSQKIKLDLSAYKPGVYILRISGAGQVCSQVIKKN
jgi:hypothetical protein